MRTQGDYSTPITQEIARILGDSVRNCKKDHYIYIYFLLVHTYYFILVEYDQQFIVKTS